MSPSADKRARVVNCNKENFEQPPFFNNNNTIEQVSGSDEDDINIYVENGVEEPLLQRISLDRLLRVWQGNSNMVQTTINGMNILCGIGLLATPYAVVMSGIGSLAVVVLLAMICTYTGILLKRCMDLQYPACISYPDVGKHAFGKIGHVIVTLTLYIELLCGATVTLILGGDNFAQMTMEWYYSFGGIFKDAQTFWIVVVTLGLLPLSWIKDLRYVSYISWFGQLSMIGIFAIILDVGLQYTGFHNFPGPIIQKEHFIVGIGIYLFCFSGHSVFPNIYLSMREKQKFGKAIGFSLMSVAGIYVLMSILGLSIFGQYTAQQITLSVNQQFPNSIQSKIIGWIVIISPFSSFPLIIAPIATGIEEFLPDSIIGARFCAISIVIRTTIVMLAMAIALMVPYFAYFASLVGSVLTTCLSFVYPCVCYLKIAHITKHKIGVVQTVFCVIIPIVGLLVGAAGCYNSVIALSQAFHANQ